MRISDWSSDVCSSDLCIVYGYDNSKRVALPQAVVFALTHEEVVSVVQLCNEFSLPLVVRGRGTNTTGATVPIAGGIVLSLEPMNRVLRISPGDRLLECEAWRSEGQPSALQSLMRSSFGVFCLKEKDRDR